MAKHTLQLEAEREALDELEGVDLKDAIGVAVAHRRHVGVLGDRPLRPVLPVGGIGIDGRVVRLEGQLEAAVVEYYTDLDIMHEYRDLFHRYNVRKAELFLEGGVDFLLIESSGSLTMQSPEIFEDMQLETLKVITRMYKEAGVPTMFHSCGISRALLPILAEQTDLDGIQPLEPPPTGDIDLAETKREFGDRLALMGNLNTPELMLRGTVEEVFDASCAAIEAAKENGGFILSTGDQCGRDTPDENIFAMVRAVEEVGGY